VQVFFFRLNNQTVCYVWKTFVFQCVKGNYWKKNLPFWDCLNELRKIENPVKCNAWAVDQKIVTAWLSGNVLISTESLVRISWNLVEKLSRTRVTCLQTKIEIRQRTCSEYLSVKTSRDQCQKASSFLSFVETNDGKNLTTGFSENKSNPLFIAGLLPAVLPWKRYLIQ